MHLATSPGKQIALAQLAATQAQALGQYMRERLQAAPHQEQVLVEPPAQDRRFVDPAWRKWPFVLSLAAVLPADAAVVGCCDPWRAGR